MSRPVIVSLDCSTLTLSLALLRADGVLVEERKVGPPQRQSEILPAEIEKILTAHGHSLKDVTGFDTVMVNGAPVAVSVSNPLTVTIGGTTRLVTACVADDASSPPVGPGTLTISVALDYAQYDRVLRSDAPKIIRQASRQRRTGGSPDPGPSPRRSRRRGR